MLVALSIREIKDRHALLDNFFAYSNSQEKDFQEIIKKLSKISPKFTFSLFEKYVKAFCGGKFESLLPFTFANLKSVSDQSLQVQKEILEAFSNLSKADKEKTIDLIKKLG